MTSVCLVDGVGRPKLLSVEHAGAVIEFMPIAAHGTRAWPMGPVLFDLTRDEFDPDGRLVYRQRGMGTPAIRWPRTIDPPRLRIEGATEGEGTTGD